MRIKKKNIGENNFEKNLEDKTNMVKGAIERTTGDLKGIGVKNAEEIAANIVSNSLENGDNDVVSEVGSEKVHTAKFDRCVADVEKKGDVDNPYAVCQASLGADAIKKSHQKKDEDEYVKTEDTDPGTGEDFDLEGRKQQYNLNNPQPNVDDEEWVEIMKSLSDNNGVQYDDTEGKDEKGFDLPFESVRPKMTKDELIESVKRNTTKKRKVIKTISVKNLRNE